MEVTLVNASSAISACLTLVLNPNPTFGHRYGRYTDTLTSMWHPQWGKRSCCCPTLALSSIYYPFIYWWFRNATGNHM